MLATFLLSPSFCCARRPTLSRRVWSSTSSCVTKSRKITTSANATPSSTTTTTTTTTCSSSSTTTTTTTTSSTAPVSLFWKRRPSHDGDNDTDQVERGMSNLLLQSSPAQRPALLVRRPVSFKRAVRVTLTMVLDGRAILQCLSTTGSGDSSNGTTMDDDDDDLVQAIQRMARQYQEHMQRITVVLTHLRRYDKALRVKTIHKTTLHLTLPDSLFFPHSPSKARACVWLQDLGIQPDTPGFELHEETYTSTCSKQASSPAASSAIIGPGYFKDIQLFLDQVDHLIERNMAFSNASSASRNNRIPTSS